MTEAKPKPKWKRVLRLALKIYAGICALLVTVYLGFFLWWISFGKSLPENSEPLIMASYREYVAKEYPKRADYFCRLAGTLGMHSKEHSIAASNVVKYMGKPDLIAGSLETGTVVYFYDHLGATNKWAVYADLEGGKLAHIGFNDATVNDHSVYQSYPTQ